MTISAEEKKSRENSRIERRGNQNVSVISSYCQPLRLTPRAHWSSLGVSDNRDRPCALVHFVSWSKPSRVKDIRLVVGPGEYGRRCVCVCVLRGGERRNVFRRGSRCPRGSRPVQKSLGPSSRRPLVVATTFDPRSPEWLAIISFPLSQFVCERTISLSLETTNIDHSFVSRDIREVDVSFRNQLTVRVSLERKRRRMILNCAVHSVESLGIRGDERCYCAGRRARARGAIKISYAIFRLLPRERKVCRYYHNARLQCHWSKSILLPRLLA